MLKPGLKKSPFPTKMAKWGFLKRRGLKFGFGKFPTKKGKWGILKALEL